jgi:hypothetical protein
MLELMQLLWNKFLNILPQQLVEEEDVAIYILFTLVCLIVAVKLFNKSLQRLVVFI